MQLQTLFVLLIASISAILFNTYTMSNNDTNGTHNVDSMISQYHTILQNKSILLVGGNGYIGSHIAVELLNIDAQVTIVDNLINSNIEVINRIKHITQKTPTFIECDLLDYDTLESKVFKDKQYDAVIHLAALKAVGESVQKPLLYYHNNIVGTINLLKLCDAYKLYNIVFSSSATVYGLPKSNPITESAQLGSTNPYGQTKYMIELMLMDIARIPASQYKIVLLRYFNPIGAHPSGLIGEDPNGVPNNLVPYIAQVAAGRTDRPYVSIYGTDYNTRDGTGVRDYIHIVDLARGHLAALAHGIYGTTMTTNCEAYNLGTGTGYSVYEVLNAYSKAANKQIPSKVVARRAGDVAECYADPSKAQRELHWYATHTLQEACDSSYKWQSNNPNGYNKTKTSS